MPSGIACHRRIYFGLAYNKSMYYVSVMHFTYKFICKSIMSIFSCNYISYPRRLEFENINPTIWENKGERQHSILGWYICCYSRLSHTQKLAEFIGLSFLCLVTSAGQYSLLYDLRWQGRAWYAIFWPRVSSHSWTLRQNCNVLLVLQHTLNDVLSWRELAQTK